MLSGVEPHWFSNGLGNATTLSVVRKRPNSLLRFWRELRQLTVTELAHRSGTTPQQITKLEHGQRRMSDSWKIRLSATLNIDPMDLFPGADLKQRKVELQLLQEFRRLADADKEKLISMTRAMRATAAADQPYPGADAAPAAPHSLHEPEKHS